MIADYVMKGIDNLFSEKLFTSNHAQLSKQGSNSSTSSQLRTNFNKDIIKTKLNNVIRRDGSSRSPIRNQEKSLSPISKSRLKSILETNRSEKIKSVVKLSS